jgi:hypothetical protein
MMNLPRLPLLGAVLMLAGPAAGATAVDLAGVEAAAPLAWTEALPPGQWCAMHERYLDQPASDAGGLRGVCPPNGPCDEPDERDAAIPDPDTPIKYVRLVFHVFCHNDGSQCLVTPADVDAQVAQINANYAPWRIQFSHETRVWWRTRYRNFASDEEALMKTQYAEEPDRKLNIYVVQTSGYSFGYFPWWADALGTMGGIVLHAGHMLPGAAIPSHEIGHNLGLWHTHHGVSEVPACSECYEPEGSPNRDNQGDFCADTEPTPVSFLCGDPGGQDACSALNWDATSYLNYMGYAPWDCTDEFSPQQAGRMQCWIEDRLSSWLATPGCPGDLNENAVVDVSDVANVLSQYGQSGAGLSADFDGDGWVGLPDLTFILSAYGAACP